MITISTSDISAVKTLVAQLQLPETDSHKGQNGKLLVIGGSELFHASLIWSAEIASKLVDMVHVTSPAEVNNDLMRYRLKEKFWNGIVIPWSRVDDYITEDDVILIGPGMPRREGLEAGEEPTAEIVNRLVSRYHDKKWVIDGGALQEIDPGLLSKNMIITPHEREYQRFRDNLPESVILRKGRIDVITYGGETIRIEGGNPGMTKGGTGDVLAGMVAALATENDLYLSAQVGSAINKLSADQLYQRVGFGFNASDLVNEIPQTLHKLLS